MQIGRLAEIQSIFFLYLFLVFLEYMKFTKAKERKTNQRPSVFNVYINCNEKTTNQTIEFKTNEKTNGATQ